LKDGHTTQLGKERANEGQRRTEEKNLASEKLQGEKKENQASTGEKTPRVYPSRKKGDLRKPKPIRRKKEGGDQSFAERLFALEGKEGTGKEKRT